MSARGTIVELLRHGDTGHSSFRGQLDDPLTGLGWNQLDAAVEQGGWDAVVSSPLRRCRDFARKLAQSRNLPLQMEPRLAEYHFGDWQGMSMAKLAERHGEALGRFWADPGAFPPPGAETMHAFRKRLMAALDDIVAVHAGSRVLVLTHGGAIRLLRCVAERQPLSAMSGYHIGHASLHRLEWPPTHAVEAPA